MATSESGRGSRARGSGRARTPRQARPAVRRPRTRSTVTTEPARHTDTRDDVVDDTSADTGAVAVLERPEDDRLVRLPTMWHRLASVNSKRALGTLLVLVLLALTLAVPVRTYLAQRGEFNRLQAENEQLAQDVDHYQRRVTEQNDPAYIESQARDRLQYVMPGEKPVVLTYPYRDRRQAEEQKAREYAANPWYQNLWDAVSTPPEGQ